SDSATASCSTMIALAVFFQAEDGIRDATVTGVQTCALPISRSWGRRGRSRGHLLIRTPRGWFKNPQKTLTQYTRHLTAARRVPQIGRASCRERVYREVETVSVQRLTRCTHSSCSRNEQQKGS